MKTCLIVIDVQESFRHRPYFVAHAGKASGVCESCRAYRFDDIQTRVGGALFVTLGVTFDFHGAAPEKKGRRLEAKRTP